MCGGLRGRDKRNDTESAPGNERMNDTQPGSVLSRRERDPRVEAWLADEGWTACHGCKKTLLTGKVPRADVEDSEGSAAVGKGKRGRRRRWHSYTPLQGIVRRVVRARMGGCCLENVVR